MVEVGGQFCRSSRQPLSLKQSSRAGCSGPCPVGFFNLQGWRSHDLSGQHVPVFDHVHSMKGFCILKWNFLFLLSHTLCLLSFHWASLTEVWCCLFYFLSTSPNPIFIHIDKILPKPSLPQAQQSQLSQTLLVWQVLWVLHLCGLLLDSHYYIHVLLMPEPRTSAPEVSPQCLIQGKHHLPWHSGSSVLDAAHKAFGHPTHKSALEAIFNSLSVRTLGLQGPSAFQPVGPLLYQWTELFLPKFRTLHSLFLNFMRFLQPISPACWGPSW